ncbi:MAG: hypothetical protein IMX00_04485 [Limnochordales bacterium]|nr:hypothetical protein [Limnochordales bacterium]
MAFTRLLFLLARAMPLVIMTDRTWGAIWQVRQGSSTVKGQFSLKGYLVLV